MKTSKTGQIVRGNGNASNDMRGVIERMAPEIARALPKHVSADRMVRIALTALSVNPKLAKCTQVSFLGSVVQASQLGLEVNTPLGQAYLVPYKDSCQLIIGYQGMMDLARRSGEVGPISAHAVHDGDEFSYELGLHPDLKHVPSQDQDRKDKPITHVYAVAVMKSGEPIFTVLTIKEVERYRNRSMARSSGPWRDDYEAMVQKTAVRRLFRWLPKSAEMATAAIVDEAPEIGRSQLEHISEDALDVFRDQGLDVDAEIVDTSAEEAEVKPKQEAPVTTDAREPGDD